MESKIRIKMGALEVECEGPESFIKNDLLGFIEKISDLYKSNNIPEVDPDKRSPRGGAGHVKLSTGSIAVKLGCKKGPDLALAASAHLALSSGRDTFTRQEVLDQMKTASAFYKKSYSGNLTALLNGLVKAGKLNEPATGKYCLTPGAKKQLENTLVKSS